MRHHISNITLSSNESPLPNRLAATQDLPILLTRASRLVHQDPGREAAVFGQGLLDQKLFSTEIRGQRQQAAPFFAVGVELCLLF